MSFRLFNQVPTAAACALLAVLLLASASSAHDGLHKPGTQTGPRAQASLVDSNDYRTPPESNIDSRRSQLPHGGQVTATKRHLFEVVYTPQETRLYTYSLAKLPLNARAIGGDVIMTVNGNPREFRYRLNSIVDDSPPSKDFGYLGAAVDLTRVRNGDMQVTFDLELTSREEPHVRFTQTFALTRLPVPVTVARLIDADRPLIARQRVCPVMGVGLGEHGPPIKLIVGNRPLFVCCQGCIEEVQNNPQRFLQSTSTAGVQAISQSPAPQVKVFWAAQADDAAIRAQVSCPVMDQPLGAHGKPLKVVIDGRPIYVCCEGCIDKVVQGRSFYFRKAADAMASRRAASASSAQLLPQRRIAVSYATEADRPAVEAQRVCPVMNQPLGKHGTPLKITIDGQTVFVCCQSCVGKVEHNTNAYFSPVGRDQYTSGNDVSYPQLDSEAGGSCCSSKSKGCSCH